MNPNIVVQILLSVLTAAAASVLALWSGWGLLAAFVVYSLGGAMTLVLLVALSTAFAREGSLDRARDLGPLVQST